MFIISNFSGKIIYFLSYTTSLKKYIAFDIHPQTVPASIRENDSAGEKYLIIILIYRSALIYLCHILQDEGYLLIH